MSMIQNTLNESEFICYAMYRITQSNYNKLRTRQYKKIELEPMYESIISPPGSEGWFPNFCRNVHILQYEAKFSLPIIVVALIYISRIKQAIPGNPERGVMFSFFVVALILSRKMYNDNQLTAKWWAQKTRFTTKQLKNMERLFLERLGDRLYVSGEEYQQWLNALQILKRDHQFLKSSKQLDRAHLQDRAVPNY
ncbi:hypothetical protein HK103_001087 [Boothiomyces macroporosus]|uniref:Cyclin N-terminal domain-containing protein n=1 Tax=Boothiomyces macroporosus TaxID=261099 RepID=A0AAD5UEI6_9FUNG|nr:hypothetical protein HK103_001087 [Boothiomyces macroporosus]